MRKKVLMVVLSLAFLLLVVTGCVYFLNIKSMKEKDNTEKYLINAAKKYFNDSNIIDNYYNVSLNTLIDNGYVDENELTDDELSNKDNIVLNYSNTSALEEAQVSVIYSTRTSSYNTNISCEDFNATVSHSSSSSNSTFESYLDETTGEEIFKITNIEDAQSKFDFTVTSEKIKENPDHVFVFRAQVKTENVVGSKNVTKGARLLVWYTSNGYSWGSSHKNVLNTTNEWQTIDIVVMPQYNYFTQTTEDATIPVKLSLGGTMYSEYASGTAYFKGFELIDAEDVLDAARLNEDEKLVILESTDKKIKSVSYLHEREQYNISNEDLQKRINILEEVYDSYAELVGGTNRSEKLLYPYDANQLVIIQTNTLQSGYGGLANNPIMIGYDNGLGIYNGTDNSFNFGLLHEMGHTFSIRAPLTSLDKSITNTGIVNTYNKWNFDSEMWANIVIFYSLYKNIVTVERESTDWDYLDLLNNMKGDGHDGFNYLIYNAITEYNADGTVKNVNFDAMKNLHKWFNDTEFGFLNNDRRVIYYLAKLDEYSNGSFKSSVSESDINSIKSMYGIVSATEDNADIAIEVNTIDFLPLNSYFFQPFIINESINDVVYYSSDESIATIDEMGIIKTFDKEGTVTITAKSYFNDLINESVEIKVEDSENVYGWNISKDLNSNVIVIFDEASGTLRLTGTGSTKNFSSTVVKPWQDYESQIKSVVVEEGVTGLGESLFEKLPNLETIKMSDTVLEIGQYFCNKCSSLKNINFSKNLRTIGRTAFYGTNIESIELPESIESIGHNAFWDIQNIKYLKLPNKTINLGNNIFALSVLNIPVLFAGDEVVEIKDFDLVKRLNDSEDAIYSAEGLNYTGTVYNAKTGLVSISLNDAKNGSTTIGVPSSSGILSYFMIKFIPEITMLDHLEITESPKITSYINGEDFNSEGMVINAVFKSDDGKEYTKTITDYEISNHENLITGQTEVTITYTFDGITKAINQPINVVDKLEIAIHDYVEKTVSGIRYLEEIKNETTINKFLESIETNGNVSFYYNEIEIEEGNIFTGLELRITLGRQEEIYKLVVKGDLNGDSYINTGDTMKLYRYVLDTNKLLDDANLRAARISDDELINLDDVLYLFDYILGIRKDL